VKGLLEKKNYLISMLLFMRVSFKILVKIFFNAVHSPGILIVPGLHAIGGEE